MKRLLGVGVLALGMSSLAACSSVEIEWFLKTTEPTRGAVSDYQLERLRMCESTDNYRAVSPGGLYRGAYQFDFRTWDDIAGRHFPWLVGWDPIDVEPWWQDAMTRALYTERGREPWPICGRYL